ncbi:hypothetical protein [Levilactobacillus brevis]|uniref:hypothetical protein n=1 Tax=Levilactobacillus brevis TaxID=1580 RepID=UPI000BE8E669|nr:hypothetical protein [Levilactobacillus brevis]
MAIIDLLHPVYIELTGYTYKHPAEYGLLRSVFGSPNELAVNTDKCIIFNKKITNLTWDLKRATRENYKPLYYESMHGLSDEKVSRYLLENKSKLGKGVYSDLRVLDNALSFARTTLDYVVPDFSKRSYKPGNTGDLIGGYLIGSYFGSDGFSYDPDWGK